jgi:hypothetical protein
MSFQMGRCLRFDTTRSTYKNIVQKGGYLGFVTASTDQPQDLGRIAIGM